MANRRTSVANFFETTLTADMGPVALTASMVTTGTLTSASIVVIEPDSSTQREVILFDGAFTATSMTTTNIANRYLAGSAAGSGLTHPAGSIVRSAPIAQHVDDLGDRVGGHVHTGGVQGTQLGGGAFVDNSISGVKLTDTTVAGLKLANDTITATQLAAGAVGTTELVDAAVTDVKLASNAVTTTKILDTAVTTTKIGDLQIVTGKLADLAVTDLKLAANAVTTAKIVDAAVTAVKLNTDARSKLAFAAVSNGTFSSVGSIKFSASLTIPASWSTGWVVIANGTLKIVFDGTATTADFNVRVAGVDAVGGPFRALPDVAQQHPFGGGATNQTATGAVAVGLFLVGNGSGSWIDGFIEAHAELL